MYFDILYHIGRLGSSGPRREQRYEKQILEKIVGVLLALVMLVSVVPASVISVLADYEDGMECWNCDHYHWDEYCCGMCGACRTLKEIFCGR